MLLTPSESQKSSWIRRGPRQLEPGRPATHRHEARRLALVPKCCSVNVYLMPSILINKALNKGQSSVSVAKRTHLPFN